MPVPRLALAALLSIGITLLAFVPGGTQQPPEDFVFEAAQESPGPVTFSHAVHADKGVWSCRACHYEAAFGGTKIFAKKRGKSGPVVHQKMDAGEQCGACHDGKTEVGGVVVFATSDRASCGRCHEGYK